MYHSARRAEPAPLHDAFYQATAQGATLTDNATTDSLATGAWPLAESGFFKKIFRKYIQNSQNHEKIWIIFVNLGFFEKISKKSSKMLEILCDICLWKVAFDDEHPIYPISRDEFRGTATPSQNMLLSTTSALHPHIWLESMDELREQAHVVL